MTGRRSPRPGVTRSGGHRWPWAAKLMRNVRGVALSKPSNLRYDPFRSIHIDVSIESFHRHRFDRSPSMSLTPRRRLRVLLATATAFIAGAVGAVALPLAEHAAVAQTACGANSPHATVTGSSGSYVT